MVKIYTDGSSKPSNPGPAGFATIITKEDTIVALHSEFIGHGTNNIAELSAIKYALEHLERLDLSWENIIIHTDSKYCIGVLIEDWRAKKNVSLITNIKDMLESFPNLQMEWVKAHNGDRFNEMADQLAKQIIDINAN